MQTTHRDDSVIYVLAQDYNVSVYILSNDSLNCVNELCQLYLKSEAIQVTKVGRYFGPEYNVNTLFILKTQPLFYIDTIIPSRSSKTYIPMSLVQF